MSPISRTSSLPIALSLFLLLPVSSRAAADSHDGCAYPVAKVDGRPVCEQELLESVGTQQWMQLLTQEYQTKNNALENLVRLKLVQAEARKRGVSAEKLIEQEVDSQVGNPTDGEVEAYFLGQNRADANLETAREQIRATLKQARMMKARQAYADSLRAKIDVTVLLRPPSIDVAFDPARVKGDPKSPVTIVEFYDYQCPFCNKIEPVLKGLLDKYSGRVKLAYMDFPLTEIHPRAESAAEASRCAGEQGKFWEFHDSLFADAGKLEDSDLIARARTLGLREEPFRSCLAGGKFRKSVDADRETGIKAGVAGTPGFFVNGVFLSGAQSPAEFEKLIDLQLSFSGRSSDRVARAGAAPNK